MTYIVVTFVLVLLVNCAISLKCLEGINGGECTHPLDNVTTPQPFEITTHTAEPLQRPKSLNMVMEEDGEGSLMPIVQITTTIPEAPSQTTTAVTTHFSSTIATGNSSTNTTDEPKARAINFTLDKESSENGLTSNPLKEDLSDVDMDDEEHEEAHARITIPKSSGTTTFGSSCIKGGLTYENGEKLENGCDSICTCINGQMNCTERCFVPYIRRGKTIDDPLCVLKDVEDPCCSIMVCEADTETEPLEICTHKNKTYKRSEKIEDGCDSFCTCEAAGKVLCKPRCVAINKTSDRCVEVSDPTDSCCKKLLCDVTLDDNEPEKDQQPEMYHLKLLTARFINDTTVKLDFDTKLENINILPEIEVSRNKTSWIILKLQPGGYLKGLNASFGYVRIKTSDDIVQIIHKVTIEQNENDVKKTCEYKGQQLKIGEEMNDNCTSLCVCRESGIHCLQIECPTYFGVDVLNPSCIEWETEPPNFVPSPPNCCPKSVHCKTTGNCLYEKVTYNNWQEIPSNITGCEKRCFCEMGKVECQSICPPVTALPPANLRCPPHLAVLDHLPDDDCCLYWVCGSGTNGVTGLVNNNSMEIKESMENTTRFPSPFVLPTSETPSKILGPLVVYTNKEPDDNGTMRKEIQRPNITLDENPYLHYKQQKDHNNKKELYQDKPSQKKPDHSDPGSPPYLGPFSPTNLPLSTNTKQKVSNKSKPVKGNSHYTPFDEQSQSLPTPSLPFVKQPPVVLNHPHIKVHGKGDPDDLLQFINQFPDLGNYPSGSVFEIHNVQHNQRNPDVSQHINPNLLTQSVNNQRPIGPYVIQNPQHPQDINVEHILQHIQKSSPFIPFPNPQVPQHNGHLLITAPNGLIIPNNRPQHNLTQPGVHDHIYPGGFVNIPPGFQQHHQDEINVNALEAIDAHIIRLAFTVPPVIVGLHGRVEVRYTDTDDNDPNTWERQIFAPPNDLIETAQLEFDLLGLKEDTEYKLKITIMLRDLHNTPSSRIYTVRTMKETQITTLPPMIPIEPNLMITDINATWVNVAWRKFSEYELQFIDGVQLRYKEIDGKIYAATPLIHRAVTTYTLENLKPNTKYEAGIFFIPFPGQSTELHAEHMIHFTTANEFDNYGFNVTLEIGQVKSTSVEITWSGVPYPEDKYVNIYRAIYQSDSGKGDFSTFKIAKRDSPSKTVIMDLKPGVRYRLWLEVYLTNGRIKTSNVQDFNTKPRTAPSLGASTQQGKLEADDLTEHKGDYYGPLVIVAILAAIAILSTLVLLLILVKRHSQNKAAITPPPRMSQSAYDNPTYKVEIQQETMDL